MFSKYLEIRNIDCIFAPDLKPIMIKDMKKVRHNGKVMDKFSVCAEIDRIYVWRNAVICMDIENYDYWRNELYRYICEYCPQRLKEFTNLY